ncbi:NHL repeat-containing protein [Microbacterium xanthum]|uniref:NHL repeat-containing protein n=1 Tax=Microbacterium xanthum TaxID=3079794 RepID=UPI002AD41AD6|nr:NHL repeat-containing protein [Microbacterium sp. KSW-48]MDZ8170999.1 NHL repeat-containing protein [Microbacterium sp. KSW-48]
MGHRRAYARLTFAMAAAIAVALTGCAAITESSDADGGIHGTVDPVTAGAPTAGWEVRAWAIGAGEPLELGTTTTDDEGDFHLDAVAVPEDRLLLLEAALDGAERADLVTVSASPETTDMTVNERTTVAASYGLAQFFGRELPSGENPGLTNAAAMAANLADPATGAYGDVLLTSPNAYETQTLPTFTSLTNVVGACLVDREVCRDILETAGAGDTASLPSALAAIARDPSAHADDLFELSQLGQGDRPGLDAAPAAWTLALRFDGDGTDLAGPGNFAIDPDGNIWINNNYEYNADPQTPVCGSDQMFAFSPTGELLATYEGGGLSGSGYGIDFTSAGLLWFSNFGFAAATPGCPEDQQPPHNSMSLFTYDGEPLSPDTGFTGGDLSWPQGIEVSANDDVWIASCGNDTVSLYPGGDPEQAVNFADLGLEQPFDVVDNGEHIYVTGIANNTVAVLGRDGTPVDGSPVTDPGLQNPMGLTVDPRGNVWVANSGTTTLPCPDRPADAEGTPSVSLMSSDGASVAATYSGGGVTRPWGIATDGDGNVWVANFADQRLSAFCGADPTTCPRGLDTGDAISPDDTGYAFDGFTRNTGVAVDPSGNVWVANNWENVPVQTNPGAHQIVAFVGAAAPLPVEPFTTAG